MIMAWNLNVEAPANGRVGKATVMVEDDQGQVLFTDKCDLTEIRERRRLSKRIIERCGGEQSEIERRLEERWAQVFNERREHQNNPSATAVNEIHTAMLDGASSTLRRPLALIQGRAYAAAWPIVETVTRQTVDPKTGGIKRHDPPLKQSASRLAIIRDDGCLFCDGVPDATPLAQLGLEVSLPSPIPSDRSWSGAGVKRFRLSDRPDPADVFHRVICVIDSFMDFRRSLAPQGTMCELVGCYTLGTYFLPALNVVGYLWPNGDTGSGKTNLLVVVCELGYLGQVILAGGSYACLRDLADYGATLGFDDAEAIMNVRKADPDKRALLLAGNRRGALITVKEPTADRGWTMRYIDAFCPRLFSAIRLPDPVLGSRSIIVPLVRSPDPERAKRNPLDYAVWPCDRRRLLDDLWAIALTHLPKIPAYDAAAARQSNLTGRRLDGWRSILAVALWLQEDHGVRGLYDRMAKLSTDYQGECSELDSSNAVIVAIKALLQMTEGADDSYRVVFETRELVSRMNGIAQQDELVDPDKTFTSSRKLGWILKRLRFEKADDRTARGWKTTRKEMESIARTYGLTAP
jgi:hypothetical protein